MFGQTLAFGDFLKTPARQPQVEDALIPCLLRVLVDAAEPVTLVGQVDVLGIRAGGFGADGTGLVGLGCV